MKRRLFKYLMFCLCPHSLHAQIITIVAGSGIEGYSGDSSIATIAQMGQPSSVAVDDLGNIYFFDSHYDNIRKVSASGIISTIAGDRHREGSPRIQDVIPCYTQDGGPAVAAIVWKPQGIATDHSGNVYFTEACGGIRKISPDGIITTAANNRQLRSYNGDSDLAVNAMRFAPRKIVIDKNENIYYADDKANVIRRISKNGIVSTIAGNGSQGYSGDGAKATKAQLNGPWGVAADDSGNIYINDRGNGRIRKVNTAGVITTIAGSGEVGYSGDGGPALDASFHDPQGIAVSHDGDLYIADARNDAIRRIDANGIITTFAGNGKRLYHGDDGIVSSYKYSQSKGNAGDGGPATAAQLYWPVDVSVDNAGNVYIADDQHHAIRKVTAPPHTPKATQELQTANSNDNFTISADVERSELIINVDTGSYTSYTISDMQNKELIQGTITQVQTNVDVSRLLPGSYYITVKKNDKTKTLRFVLEH
jgi:hypothetical protein